MSMSIDEEQELREFGTNYQSKQPTDKEIIIALRKELIRTQRAYLIEQGKSIAMQMDMLNIEEQKLLAGE